MTAKITAKKFFLLVFFYASFFAFLLFSFVFIFYWKTKDFYEKENQRVQKFLGKNTFDSVVIFTGDTGRIPLGIQTALENQIPKIFITGVFNKNKISTILKTHFPDFAPVDTGESKALQRIEIDYLAQNTLGNVLSTLQFLRRASSYKNILIVSSDYHLLRIHFIFQRLIDPREEFRLFYLGVPGLGVNSRGVKMVFKELIKLFNIQGIFLFWDSNQ